MYAAIAEFVTTQQGDSAEFMGKARAIAIGIARDFEPARLYAIRIDNWFGPRWMHFAGTFTAGKFASVGIHKARLHVPPFVPHRVVAQRVIVGPDYEETVTAALLHIECPSKQAITRRIADIDKDAAFVWFSGESEAKRRGSVMVYLPTVSQLKGCRQRLLRSTGAFYVGFSQRGISWKPAMLRGVSRSEVMHLEEGERASTDNEVLARAPCT